MSKTWCIPSSSLLTLIFVGLSCMVGWGRQTGVVEARVPPADVDLSKFGYAGFSPLARFTGRANLTLNFIDADHVLFTFNAQKLIVRHPECPPTHADRIIHAVVIDIRDGTPTAAADWYVHDQRRYLWPLGGGRLLLRRLNSIYEIDSGLKERLLYESPNELLWTGVTADGKQIILESALEEQPTAAKSDGKPVRRKTKIEFRDVQSMAVARAFSAADVLKMESTGSGYADAVHNIGHKIWLIRFGPSAAERRNLMRVKSPCEPNLLFPTQETLFVGRCAPNAPEYSVSVFTVSGHPLWRQRWKQLQHVPAVVSSEDGSRMAVSTVTASREVGPSQASSEDEVGWPQVEQEIRVLETASGGEVLSTRVGSVILQNPNYSLSPDGRRLAVADGTALRIYELAPMGAEERAKYVAMKADAPDLSAPASRASDSVSGTGEGESDFEGEDTGRPDVPTPVRGGGAAESGDAGSAPSLTSQVATAPKPGTGKAPDLTTFKARAEEVIVDVVVTDGKGHPVKGLSKQDFQLEEDGKQQNVTSMHEFGEGMAAAPKEPAAKTVAPSPNVFSNNSTIASDEPLGIILLDFLNTEPADQVFAKEQLLKFLRKKPPGMQFALCALTDRLLLIQGFTRDENLLMANVASKKTGARFSSPLQNMDLKDVVQTTKEQALIDASMEIVVQGLIRQQANVRAAQLDRRVAMTSDAFRQLARYVSGIPGRKSLVWLSGSFPTAFLGSRALNVDNPNQSTPMRTYSDQLRQTTNLLADAHIAVYPVNVHGLTVGSIFTADNSSNPMQTELPGSRQPAGAPPQMQMNTDAGTNRVSAIAAPSPQQQELEERNDARAAEEAALDQIASETGGRAFQNTNGLSEAMATAMELGSHYYMLSYSPENRPANGAFRKIKVSVLRKGYHVAHRRGYFAVRAATAAANDAELASTMNSAAMQRGAPQSHQLVFATRVVPVGKPGKSSISAVGRNAPGAEKASVEVQKYSVDYAIAASEVRFAQKNEGDYSTKLVFMMIAFGEKGTATNRSAAESTTTFNAKAYRDAVIGGLRMHQDIEVPVSATSLRLGVEDSLSGRLGTLELPLPLKPPPDQPVLAGRSLPPVEPN